MGAYAAEASRVIARERRKATEAHTQCLVECRQPCPNHRPWPTDADLERPGPSTDVEWEGLARMAEARRAAGRPLSLLDLRALQRREQKGSSR